MNKSKIFIISGPTASGKDTVRELLLKKHPDWQSLTTMTSRPKQKFEDPASYRFVSEIKFKQLIQESKMFEWAKVHGYYYGNTKKYIEDRLALDKPVIGDVDIQGAKTYKQKLEDRAVLIFLKAESLEMIKKRIEKRNRGESKTEIKKRLSRAKEELTYESDFDYVVINRQGSVEQAVAELEKIILSSLN
jgi:guanylate kinase